MNKPRCELCFFFREDIQTRRANVPDAPQVTIVESGHVCTIRPPTGSRGFPQTGPEMVCALFTDAVTKAQPLKRCISYLDDAAEGGGGNG